MAISCHICSVAIEIDLEINSLACTVQKDLQSMCFFPRKRMCTIKYDILTVTQSKENVYNEI